MKFSLLAAILFCFGTGIVVAKDNQCKPTTHAKVSAKSESTYHRARKALLAAGWQPVQTVRWQEKDEKLFGQAKDFWEKGYVEVEDCAGTGLSPCSFLFKDAYGNYLRVTTTGEEYPKENAYAIVSGFQFVCGH